jgi:cobalt-zinc-cadmium efflux system membrane fusion protein
MLKIRNIPLILLTAILFFGCSRPVQTEEEEANPSIVELSAEQMKQITLDTAKLKEEKTDLVLSGKVSFDKDFLSQVYSLVSGNVIKVNASLGDFVKKGEVLAVLRSGDIGDYESQYDVAQAQLRTAKRNYDIAQQLYQTKVYSDKDVMQAQNDYKAAQDNLQKLETYLKTYGISDSAKSAEYRIVSPIDGYVVGKTINEGMNIRPDNTNSVFTVSSLGTIWVLANIYENDIPQVELNDSADVSAVAYPDKPYKGIISNIGNILDSTASTLQARIVLENKDNLLKPGMFCTVKVHVDKHKKAVAVSKEALVFYDNNFYVMVTKGNNKFERKQVTIEGSNDNVSYISQGLNTGDIVVGKGSLYVLGQ